MELLVSKSPALNERISGIRKLEFILIWFASCYIDEVEP